MALRGPDVRMRQGMQGYVQQIVRVLPALVFIKASIAPVMAVRVSSLGWSMRMTNLL
jgi:hypothetical protein